MAGFAEFASAATSKASAANKAVTELAKSFKGLAGGSGDAEAAMGKLGGSFGKMVSEAAPADGIMGKVTAALSALGPEGQAVAAVLQIVTTVVLGLVVALTDLAKTAIAVSQEKDALASTFAALGQGAQDGYALVDSVSALAAALPFAEGQVLSWAKALMAAGIQGKAMEQGVQAIASATALMGREGGAAAETLIKRFAMAAETGAKLKLDRRMMMQLAAAGVSADTLAKALGVDASKLSTMAVDAAKLGDAMQKALVEKGAGALQNMALTWGSITAKLHDAWEDLFEDMGEFVRPFMNEVKELFAEFSAGASSQSIVKSVLMATFRELFAIATKVTHAIHLGFLQIEVALLKVAIAVAPFVKWLIAIYSNAAVLQGIKIMLIALIAPFVLIAAAIGIVVGAIGFLVGAVIAGVAMIGAGLAWIVGEVSNFIAGIVSGIASGTGAVVAAVTKLASSALAAFKATLGIHSPSTVMRLQGQYMAAGTVQGLDAGVPQVRAAAGRMAGAGAAGGAQGASSGRRGGMQVTFAPGSIVIDGAGKSAGQITEEMLTLVLERLAGTQGLAPV
jgi:hypothetical protein